MELYNKQEKYFLSFTKLPQTLIEIIQSYEECLTCNQYYSKIISKLSKLSSDNKSINDFAGFNDSNYVGYNLKVSEYTKTINIAIQQHSSNNSDYDYNSSAWEMNINIFDFIRFVIHQVPINKMTTIDGCDSDTDNDSDCDNKNDHHSNHPKFHYQSDSDDSVDSHSFVPFNWEILRSRLYLFLTYDRPLKKIRNDQIHKMYKKLAPNINVDCTRIKYSTQI